MTRMKWFVSITLLVCLVILLWIYNHKIIDGDYDKISIKNMSGNTVDIIENKAEIDKIIKHINNSPRTFNPNRGLRYDYMPHVIFIFENDEEKVLLGLVVTKGNVLTKFWEIETDFEFVKEME